MAKSYDEKLVVECKFHSDPKRNCDVKVPLYINSRLEVIVRPWRKGSLKNKLCYQGWMVTNTRFTSDAIQFGKCMQLHLLSWDYPLNHSLKNRVDETNTHPVTCLTTLSKKDKKLLLENGIILVRHLVENTEILETLNFPHRKKRQLLNEAKGMADLKISSPAGK